MKILVAIDDSKDSETALRGLSERISGQTAEVKVLHVVEPPSLLA
jgi:nucleotide-binding universal stress UspA family protein